MLMVCYQEAEAMSHLDMDAPFLDHVSIMSKPLEIHQTSYSSLILLMIVTRSSYSLYLPLLFGPSYDWRKEP